MKKHDRGRVLFISSESGVNIPVEMIHYGVTKTMQIALARGLAETCAGTGVTVNSVLRRANAFRRGRAVGSRDGRLPRGDSGAG